MLEIRWNCSSNESRILVCNVIDAFVLLSAVEETTGMNFLFQHGKRAWRFASVNSDGTVEQYMVQTGIFLSALESNPSQLIHKMRKICMFSWPNIAYYWLFF